MSVDAGRFTPDPLRERRQLALLALALAVLAGLAGVVLGSSVLSVVAATLAGCTALGALAFRRIGRDVYLVFALLSAGIGRVVSWLARLLAYAGGIALTGSLLRVVRMDRLDRDFRACRGRETMFRDAPETDRESFNRQS